MLLESKKIRIDFFETVLLVFVILTSLVIFKPAYDYTLIKLNLAQFVILTMSGYIYLKNRQRGYGVFFNLNQSRQITHCDGRQTELQRLPPLNACAVITHLVLGIPRLFFLYLTGYLVICFISTLTSPYKYASLNELCRLITYMSIMLITSLCISEQNIKKIIASWLVSSIFVAGYGIYQATQHKTITSTFGNPNFMAAYLVLVLPIAVCQVLYYYQFYKPLVNRDTDSNLIKMQKDSVKDERHIMPLRYVAWLGSWRVFTWLVVAILLLAGLIVAKSRGAWLGVVISGIVLGLLRLSGNKKALLFFLGGVISCLIFFWMIWGPVIVGQVSEDIRPLIWKGTLNMIKERPITGHGLGTFFIFYPKYRLKEYFLHPQKRDITRHSHCEYLEMVSETGLLGLGSFVGMIMLFFYIATRAVYNSPRNYSNFILTGLTSGLAGFLSHNLVSVNMRFPTCALFFWFGLGMGVGIIDRMRSYLDKKCIKQIGLLIFIIVFVFITIYSIKTDFIAHVYLKKGVRCRNRGDWITAIGYYQKAIAFAPYFITPYYKLGYAYNSIGDIDRAIQTYEKILAMAPYYARTKANLGTLYLKKLDYEKALFYLKEAQRLNPYDTKVLVQLALIYAEQGDRKKAIGYLERVLYIEPEHQLARRILQELIRK